MPPRYVHVSLAWGRYVLREVRTMVWSRLTSKTDSSRELWVQAGQCVTANEGISALHPKTMPSWSP